MSVQFISGGRNSLDKVTMPYRSDYRLENPHDFLKQWIGGDIDDTEYTLFRTIANKELDTILINAGLKDRGYLSAGILEYFHVYMKTVLGKDYFSFPYVEMEYSSNQSPFHPHVHILKGETMKQQDNFRKLVQQLLSEEAFDFYSERDKPQNYQQGRLKAIKSEAHTIDSPLVVLPKVAVFSGPNMKNIADFLMPYSVVSESRKNYID